MALFLSKEISKIVSLLPVSARHFGVCLTCAKKWPTHSPGRIQTPRNFSSFKYMDHKFTFVEKRYQSSQISKDEGEKTDDDKIYTHHWVGPPDPVSNLRKCNFVKQRHQNKYDLQLEREREDTHIWNNEFWTNHNNKFFEEKKIFSKKLEANGISDKEASDEMSLFYKDFLDRHYQLHMEYNREWYKRNFGMLLTSFRASIARIFQR